MLFRSPDVLPHPYGPPASGTQYGMMVRGKKGDRRAGRERRQSAFLDGADKVDAPRVGHILIQFSYCRERTQEDTHQTGNDEWVLRFHPEQRLTPVQDEFSVASRAINEGTDLQIEWVQLGGEEDG